MTPDRPDVRQLLETAAEALKNDILPAVPADRRVDVLMILNVVGMAERRIDDSGPDPLERRQQERMDTLSLGLDVEMLAEQIHEGVWDDPEEAALLHEALTADVRDRLSRINPKYLAAYDADPEGEGTRA